MHCWQNPQWPNFTFNRERLNPTLQLIRDTLEPLLLTVTELDEADQRNYLLEVMIDEVKNTSSIEGEFVSREDIRSSIINHWRLGYKSLKVKDRRAVGISQLLALVASSFKTPVTEAALKYWHGLLFNDPGSLRSIGEYRLGPEPMRIISGPMNSPTIHYEAPPAESVSTEMAVFVNYFDKRYSEDRLTNGILRSGITHLHFESIHPFEDGNGRIGRALIEQILSNTLDVQVPFSISQGLQRKHKEYYAALSSARKNLNATEWMVFYVNIILDAIRIAKNQVSFVLKKTALLDAVGDELSDSQRKALLRLFDAGPDGFDGGFSTKNYMSLTRVSRATAARELGSLVKLGALTRIGAGRSTRYELRLARTDETW